MFSSSRAPGDLTRSAPTPSPAARPEVVMFHWEQYTPYHVERVQAVRDARLTPLDILHVATTPTSREYPFTPTDLARAGVRTLFHDRTVDGTTARARLWRRLALLRRYKIRYAFLCHYELVDTFVAAAVMRLMGIKVFTMFDSKFDDKPRRFWREFMKRFFLLPYHGGLVSGRHSREYAQFLGLPDDRLFSGYDTVSVARVRADAGVPPAPDGVPFADRHFTIVARHVPKKNLSMALDAYDRYCRAAGGGARELHLCGDGELGAELAAEVERRRLRGVRFKGFVSPEVVASELGSTLALLLPSYEEQWGLVVNEALAMGVPVLSSDAVGARASLVRTGVNGYVFEPDNPKGLAILMAQVASDEAQWRRMANAALQFSSQGDVAEFVAGVAGALGVRSGSQSEGAASDPDATPRAPLALPAPRPSETPAPWIAAGAPSKRPRHAAASGLRHAERDPDMIREKLCEALRHMAVSDEPVQLRLARGMLFHLCQVDPSGLEDRALGERLQRLKWEITCAGAYWNGGRRRRAGVEPDAHAIAQRMFDLFLAVADRRPEQRAKRRAV